MYLKLAQKKHWYLSSNCYTTAYTVHILFRSSTYCTDVYCHVIINAYYKAMITATLWTRSSHRPFSGTGQGHGVTTERQGQIIGIQGQGYTCKMVLKHPHSWGHFLKDMVTQRRLQRTSPSTIHNYTPSCCLMQKDQHSTHIVTFF